MNKPIENLIAKLLLNRADQEEKAQLEAWKNDSLENLTAYKEFAEMHQDADSLKDYQDFDAINGLSKIQQKLSENFTPVKSIRQPLYGIAAVLGIGLMIGAWWFISRSTTSVYWVNHIVKANETVILPDNSTITAQDQTSITYTRNYIDTPMVIMEGRGYFNITPQQPGKQLRIQLPVGEVTVIGTAFSIFTDSLSTEIGVAEGKVRFQLDQRKVELTAHDRLKLINNDILKSKLDTENYFSWYKGNIHFENENLQTALKDLARHFNTSIELAADLNLTGCFISGNYKNQSLADILKEWSLLLDMTFIERDGIYRIETIKCKSSDPK